MISNINADFRHIGNGNSRAAAKNIRHDQHRDLRHSERQYIESELELHDEALVWAFDQDQAVSEVQ